MTVFAGYSRYYDLLYRDKDYATEAEFVNTLLQRHTTGAREILELGCGTGAHAESLARLGLSVHGIDVSETMLACAYERKHRLSAEIASRLVFSSGDLREVRLEGMFDAVIALFHVMSYQTKNSDIAAALATASRHLKPGGIFIFDFWYGPAVLNERPEVRIKRLADESSRITRIAEPVLHPVQNRVDVHYTVMIRDQLSGAVEELQEVHQMRYLFHPELTLLCGDAGLEEVDSGEWLTGRAPDLDTWGVYLVVRKPWL